MCAAPTMNNLNRVLFLFLLASALIGAVTTLAEPHCLFGSVHPPARARAGGCTDPKRQCGSARVVTAPIRALANRNRNSTLFKLFMVGAAHIYWTLYIVSLKIENLHVNPACGVMRLEGPFDHHHASRDSEIDRAMRQQRARVHLGNLA